MSLGESERLMVLLAISVATQGQRPIGINIEPYQVLGELPI